MSPPSANTRSGVKSPTPSQETKDPPSTEAKLTKEFSFSVAIRSLTEKLEPTKDASAVRQELLHLLMNPKADQDPEACTEFYRKLVTYNTVGGPLNAKDVLFSIASKCFGMKQFKLVLIGAAGVGKTAFVAKHLNNQFIQKYNASNGAEVTSLVFQSSDGLVKFDVWDTAGCDKLGSLRDGYYVGADCALLMYDVTRATSQRALPHLYKDLMRVRESIPVVVVGNKSDDSAGSRKIKPNQGKLAANFPRKHGLRHFEVSTKKSLNIDQPLLYLARELLGNNQLRFVTGHAGDKQNATYSTTKLSPEHSLSTTQNSHAKKMSIKQPDVLTEAKHLSLPPPSNGDGGL